MTSTQINQENYTAYQPYMLLDFNFSFQNDVLKDDLSITILEVLRRINLSKFIDFLSLDPRSYDPVMMLTVILMAFAENGYASLRRLEKLCRYDVRYRSITNGCVPSYKSFERFINNTLKESIETIAKEIYLYIQDEKALEEQILYIDGTKFEANANKMTFCWRGWSRCYLPRHWQKCMELLRQINQYYQLYKRKQLPKLAGIHVAYLISINILPTRKQYISKEARQALKKMDQYSREIELLAKNKIEDIDQLNNYQQQKQDELNDLLKQRQGCYYQRQRAKTMDEKEEWSARAKLFTPEIKKLRLQIKACENIRNRSFDKDIERIAQKKIKQRDAR